LVGINEIVDAVVMHKIAPKLNILSAHLKTNEIEAEKFDSFLANEFLKPAKVQTSVTVYIEKKQPTNAAWIISRLDKRCKISIDY